MHTHMYHTKKEKEIIKFLMLGKFANNISAKRKQFDSVKELKGSV